MYSKQKLTNIIHLCRRNLATIKGFGQLSALRIAQIFLGLITTYFLAHTLTVSQYGEYQFALNVLGLLTIFSLTEFSNTVMQSVARGFHGSFKKILPYTFFTSIAGSFILVFFALWYGIKENNTALMLCFGSASLLFPFVYGLTIWRGYKIGEESFFSYTKLEMIALVLAHLCVLLSIYFFRGQYVVPFLCFMIVPAILNLLIIFRIMKHLPENTKTEDGIIKHGVISSIFGSLPVISNYIDKLFLFFFLGAESVAIFAASDRLAELLRSGIHDAATALAPRFAKTDHYSQKLDRILKISSLLFGIFLMIFAFTVLPYVIVLIYGQPYETAIPYAQALVFSVAVGNLPSLQFRYIRSKLDTKNFRNIMVVTALLRIIMSAFLVPLWGINGAVLSSVIFRVVLLVQINHVIKKDYSNPITDEMQS